MEPVFNPFDVLSLFAEVVVGQLGFQVVAVTVGRRGGGSNWSKGDTRLFFAMISCGALAISLSFSPIFLISESPLFSENNIDKMLYFSSFTLFIISYFLLFIFLPTNWKDPNFKKIIVYVGTFNIINNLIHISWILNIFDYGIKLFYYNIIYFCIMSFFFFTRLMTHHK